MKERRIFASKGEVCTCERGHPIFTFARDVYFGQIPGDKDTKLWRQKRLKAGDPIPACKTCGSLFVRNIQPFGMIVHFAEGWRGAQASLDGIIVAPSKPAFETKH